MANNEFNKKLEDFAKEFGELLDPVDFLKDASPEVCDTFLKLHELTLNDGNISKKMKFFIHAAITAALHDRDATIMHIKGAINAGASKDELLEVAFTLIPVAGMPSYAIFIDSLKKLI